MSSSIYIITEHIIQASHIREYARATSNSQDTPLSLHIKQYVPRSNPNPQQGDVTIIGAHANGFPKVPLTQPRLYSGIPADVKVLDRNYMSPCGRTCTPRHRNRVSEFVPFGCSMSRGRAKAAS